MKHLKIMHGVKQQSHYHQESLREVMAVQKAITLRIHQVGGMLELAESLPNQPHLVKGLKEHLIELFELRQAQSEGG